MKDKKTEVISYRCSSSIKEQLEVEAQKYNWSVSQLVANIIEEHIYDEEVKTTEEAKAILNYIIETNCNSMEKLITWAIENNKTMELNRTINIWSDLMKERRKE